MIYRTRPNEERSHIALVRQLSKPGGVLDPSGPHSTIHNSTWYDRATGFTAARLVLHQRLSDVVRKRMQIAQQERHAVVLAGPPGAGKGTMSKLVLGDDRESYVSIDADEFKVLLLAEAVSDGTLESQIKPDVIKSLEMQGERFYPLELASLVHTESSMLAAALRKEVLSSGANVVIDTVLGDVEVAARLGQELQKAEYEVTVIDVEMPFEVSEDRILRRWRQAIGETMRGVEGALGGRWVPSSYTRPLFDTTHGRASSQDAARVLAEGCQAVVKYERYFTSLEEHQTATAEGRFAVPVLEVSKTRISPFSALE